MIFGRCEQDFKQDLSVTKRLQSKRKDQLAYWADVFSERHPKFYLYSAVSVMFLGYASFLLVPYLVIEGVTALSREIPNAVTIEQWAVVGSRSVIVLFFLFLSGQIFRLHFPQVSGLKLSKEQVPGLYGVITKVRGDIPQPAINSVVLTDQYELRIVEAPCFGFPFLTTTTLAIGMPMLQTLSEGEFRCELMKRLGQYSRGRFQPCHWLFRSRRLWRRYLDALNAHKRLGDTPLRWFFSVYSPLFEMLTLPAARMDELAGDDAALEWLNDKDYFVALKNSSITEIFLKADYWRKVRQAAVKNPKATLKPFQKLEHISGYLGSQDLRRKCLCNAVVAKQNLSKAIPVFSARMKNIGQSKLGDAPVAAERTAAVTCLGVARKELVSSMDKHWHSSTCAQWRADYRKRCADLSMVKKLSRKSYQQPLGPREVLLYARLAKRLRGDPLRSSIEKLFKRNLEALLPSAPLWNAFHRKVKSIQGDDI